MVSVYFPLDLKISFAPLRFEEIDFRFEKVDSFFEETGFEMKMRLDKLWNFQKGQVGLMIGLFAGIYIKLFFI